jgi:histidine triad (HIT) family protein
MENCIFCKIAAGEIPSNIVFEDDFAVAFRDIAPAAPVHVLIIPRRHVESLPDAVRIPGMMDRLMRIAVDVARAERLDAGFRLIVNTGGDAGQTVHHLHLHVLGGRALGPLLETT